MTVEIAIAHRFPIDRANAKGEIDASLPAKRHRAIVRDVATGELAVVTMPAGADAPIAGEVLFTLDEAVHRARRVMAGSPQAFTHPASLKVIAAALILLAGGAEQGAEAS